MADYIIKGIDEKDKAILAHIGGSIQDWLQHAYNDKARRCVDRLVEIASDKQPKKITEDEKLAIVRGLNIEPQSDKRQEKPIEGRIMKG